MYGLTARSKQKCELLADTTEPIIHRVKIDNLTTRPDIAGSTPRAAVARLYGAQLKRASTSSREYPPWQNNNNNNDTDKDDNNEDDNDNDDKDDENDIF